MVGVDDAEGGCGSCGPIREAPDGRWPQLWRQRAHGRLDHGGEGEREARGREDQRVRGVEGVLRGGVVLSRARGSSCVASRRWPRLGCARATRNASRREEDDARGAGLGLVGRLSAGPLVGCQ